MRPKIIVAIVAALVSALVFSAPAFAHIAGPCVEAGEPGHSDFAQHHVAPLAQEGMLGAGGHIPGEHQGFSTCLEEE